MKKLIFILMMIFIIVSIYGEEIKMSEISIIPKPMEMKTEKGFFEFRPSSEICVSEDAKDVGVYLRELLKPATGYSLGISERYKGSLNPSSIVITSDGADESLGDEGYTLEVSKRTIVIKGKTARAMFYGVQSLRQLLPVEVDSKEKAGIAEWKVPCVSIKDKPRFQWRGLHLDVGRHMFPVEFLKKYIDLLAMHKMNTFHWHLTEDQGWRIEIKKYPKLTEVGSKRSKSPLLEDRTKYDDKPYGGFYTQEEVKEVVAYAKSRYITVVPEIEMPGHSVAALTSYPELGCTGGPYEVRVDWGIAKDVYCAGNEKVYGFLEDVLTEVLALFPSEFIHVGGDECPKDRWSACEKCQAMIKKHNLKDEHELQSYFIKRMETFLNEKGRRLIGWDEILEGGLAPNAAVMSWRGVKGGIAAAKQNHDVVMTPYSNCYFDYYQSKDRESEPEAIGGFLPLETVYGFKPIPEELNEEEAKHVIGVQGNVWTEHMPVSTQVEYMAYPRASALSEVGWSQADARDYDDFQKRLKVMLKRMDLLNVNYRNPFVKREKKKAE